MTKRKSFSVQSKELNLNTNQSRLNYLKGKQVEIIANTNSHNYGPVGSRFTIGQYAYVNGQGISAAKGDGQGNNITWTQFSVVTSLTEKEILNENEFYKKEIARFEELISENLSKIDFIKEVGSKEFDINEFKAYRTLQLVEDESLSRAKKAKLIAQLVQN